MAKYHLRKIPSHPAEEWMSKRGIKGIEGLITVPWLLNDRTDRILLSSCVHTALQGTVQHSPNLLSFTRRIGQLNLLKHFTNKIAFASLKKQIIFLAIKYILSTENLEDIKNMKA